MMQTPAAAIRNAAIAVVALATLTAVLSISPLQNGWSAGAGVPGLVAAYSFDEGSGSTATDASGAGRSGTVSGATWTSEGRFGWAVAFDGVDDVVSVADSSALDLAGELTLEAWVKPSAAGAQPAVVSTASGHRNYALYATSASGGPSAHVRTSSGDHAVSSDASVGAGSWTHVAMTYDGSDVKVYVNASVVASHAAAGAVVDSSEQLQIGGSTSLGEWFAGVVDEVRVYNRALSPSEIASDMSTRLAEPAPVAPANRDAPVANGAAEVDSTLTASPGTWSGTTPMSFAYGWARCDATGAACAAIAGATGQAYLLTPADAGATVRATVTASNAAGSQSATSAPTAPVKEHATATAPAPSPTAPADKKAPSTPSGLSVAPTGSDAVVSWSPSTDNVGVAGYGVYRNGVAAGSTTGENYTVTNLQCGTPATFGVDAYDAAGNRSAQATVTIPARPCADAEPPSSPTQLRTTRFGHGRISLSWAPTSDNVGVIRYGVYLDGALEDAATKTSYTFADLTCGRRYTLGVDAVDAAGNRSARATVVVDTDSCKRGSTSGTGDPDPPTVPHGLAVTAATGTSIALAWAPSTDDVGVAGYGLYVDGVRVASTAVTSATFPGLACGASYDLGVDAYDAAGNRSERTSVVAATAACVDTEAPSTPASVVQAETTQTSISISWAPSSDNVGVAGYGLYRGETRVASSVQTGYTYTGLTCGSVYVLGVDAYDAAGNRSGWGATWMATAPCLDRSPPSTPTGLIVTGVTTSSVTLAWKPSTDDFAVIAYSVSRDGVFVGRSAATTFTSSGLACGKAYIFAVEAIDSSGNRSAPAKVAGTTAACDPVSSPGTLYVAVWGVDSNPCIQVLPCASFGRAYRAAKPGDTIEVACGTYPGQVITRGSQSQSGEVITFVASPAHCATVVGWINLGENSGGEGANAPNNITIDGVDVVNGSLFTWWNGGAANRGLTLRNMKITDTSSANDLISLGSWDGLRLENLELGPACCQAVGVALGRGNFSAPLNRNVVISNLYIHDLYDTCGRWPGSLGPCSGVGFGSGCGGCRHIDGIQITDAHDIRISGSRIERLDGVSGQGIFFATANGGTFSNITIEGNTVGNLPQDDILISGPGTGIVTGYVRILNNVSYGNIIVYGDGSNNRVVAPGTEVLFSGNTGDLGTSNESDRCVLVLSNGSLFRPTWTGNTNTMRNCDP